MKDKSVELRWIILRTYNYLRHKDYTPLDAIGMIRYIISQAMLGISGVTQFSYHDLQTMDAYAARYQTMIRYRINMKTTGAEHGIIKSET